MSFSDFISYTSEILNENNARLYIEERDTDNTINKYQFNNEYSIEENRDKNLNFYISLENIIDLKYSFYGSEASKFAIEGTGGRVSNNKIERISLRLISKKPDKTTRKVFNSIKRKLKKDDSIGMGVKGGSTLHDNYFYEKSIIKMKMVTDMFNDKAPVIEVL